MYNFKITAANATIDSTYTNNGYTYTVLSTIVGSTTLTTIGTGIPDISGVLVLETGTGDATISFSAVNLIPDNRLRFPAPLIDFAQEVGLSGQDHEHFPYPDAQPRWDWLLIWYMSLLANQSSYNEPTQYRDGSLWFDMNTMTLKMWRSSLDFITGSWTDLSNSIGLETIAGTPITLKDWYIETKSKLTGSTPIATFNGYVKPDTVSAVEIPVPSDIQSTIDLINTRPFVYINGLLIDPRDCEFYSTSLIKLLNGVALVANDKFTVVVQNILYAHFYIPDVVI
jgi:hypothetical protein